MNKAGWKARALAAESALLDKRLSSPLTFDTLTVCFPDHTVTHRGQVIKVEQNCVSFPLTNDQNLLAPAGWYPIASSLDR